MVFSTVFILFILMELILFFAWTTMVPVKKQLHDNQ